MAQYGPNIVLKLVLNSDQRRITECADDELMLMYRRFGYTRFPSGELGATVNYNQHTSQLNNWTAVPSDFKNVVVCQSGTLFLLA